MAYPNIEQKHIFSKLGLPENETFERIIYMMKKSQNIIFHGIIDNFMIFSQSVGDIDIFIEMSMLKNEIAIDAILRKNGNVLACVEVSSLSGSCEINCQKSALFEKRLDLNPVLLHKWNSLTLRFYKQALEQRWSKSIVKDIPKQCLMKLLCDQKPMNDL